MQRIMLWDFYTTFTNKQILRISGWQIQCKIQKGMVYQGFQIPKKLHCAGSVKTQSAIYSVSHRNGFKLGVH